MRRKATVLVVVLGMWLGCFTLSAWCLSLLWNWVAPGFFGWPGLTLWQASFILGIATILGGFRGRSH